MNKKICIFICSILLFISSGVGAFAASSPVVYGGEIKAGQDSELKIPVKIKGNSGIMGFRITAGFDKDLLTVTNIGQGKLTENGILSDSLQPGSGDDSVDVLWSGSESISEDGTLFYIYIKTSKEFQSDTEIVLSYAKEDTFDESFEAVKLKCDSIKIVYDDSESGSKLDENPAEEYLTGEIKDEIVSQLSDEKTVEIVQKVLKEKNVKDPSNLTAEQSKEVIKDILAGMEEEGIDTAHARELLNTAVDDENIDTGEFYKSLVNELYGDSSDNLENGESIDLPATPAHKVNIALISAVAALLIALAAVVAIIIRRKRAANSIQEEQK